MTLQRGMKSIWRSVILIMALALQREAFGQGSFEGQIRDSYPAGTNFVSNGQRNATAEVRFVSLFQIIRFRQVCWIR